MVKTKSRVETKSMFDTKALQAEQRQRASEISLHDGIDNHLCALLLELMSVLSSMGR